MLASLATHFNPTSILENTMVHHFKACLIRLSGTIGSFMKLAAGIFQVVICV